MYLVGLSFIKENFGDYVHYWISEEYSTNNNYNYPSSSHNSNSNAFTMYIDGTPSMNVNCLDKSNLAHVIEFF